MITRNVNSTEASILILEPLITILTCPVTTGRLLAMLLHRLGKSLAALENIINCLDTLLIKIVMLLNHSEKSLAALIGPFIAPI